MIEARGISKHFGRRKVLSNLDLPVHDGEVVSLMGSNGSGKTTLLRILSTLSMPSAGDVLLDGKSAQDDPLRARKLIGVVGHSTYTYDDLTALENLKFYWSMNGMPSSGSTDASAAMLRRVGLSHRMNDKAAVFSKGMRQRLAIARALIHSPKVLLLDEPFSSLDQKGVDILSQIVQEERARGCAVLVVTHDISRIAVLADRADVLAGGRITASYHRDEIEQGELERCYRKATEVGVT